MNQDDLNVLGMLLQASAKSKAEGAYEKTADVLLEMFKDDGVVPFGCTLHSAVILVEQKAGRDPCLGCNLDRSICGGRDRGGVNHV